MNRYKDWTPHGVIPAVLLPFRTDFSIDERSYRKHLRDVVAVDGIAAITVNGHSSEVHACTVEEQRDVLAITLDEVGERLPVVSGVYADGSLEAARIARLAEACGASRLLVFPLLSAADWFRLSRLLKRLFVSSHLSEVIYVLCYCWRYCFCSCWWRHVLIVWRRSESRRRWHAR